MRLIHLTNLTRPQAGISQHHFEGSLICGRTTSSPKQHGRHFAVANISLTSAKSGDIMEPQPLLYQFPFHEAF
jgi:hypothetical protein